MNTTWQLTAASPPMNTTATTAASPPMNTTWQLTAASPALPRVQSLFIPARSGSLAGFWILATVMA